MRILVVEDDVDIAEIIRECLVDQHYYVDIVQNGLVAAEQARINDYDLLILDVMLPGKSGKDLCRELRRDGLKTPILMLTALASEIDIVEGLDLGADDYLAKPFSIAVLMARVRSLTRRQFDQRTTVIHVADLMLDTANRRVERAGKAIDLTAKEFALLEYFVLNQGRLVTRTAIIEHVWDMHYDARSNVIEALMRNLRQKIDRDHPLQLIHTIRGAGYRFHNGTVA